MENLIGQEKQKRDRQIAKWLLIGVIMIVIQILLGGITRLTESGLSITEWKPLTKILPPLNNTAWQIEFDKYRTTDQFKYVHQSFSLNDFKQIFFWEWLHRFWAKLLGVVFLIGFIYFLIKRKMNRQMVIPMIILFILGAMQGAVGWIMVKSGLVPQKYFVGHVELTTHFVAALILLSYLLWFALSLMPSMHQKIKSAELKNILSAILILVFIQLIYGGFMAGLKAAATAPTWPDIHGAFIPAGINEMKPWGINLVNNPLTIQFIHRGIGYLLVALIIWFYLRSKNMVSNVIFKKLRITFLILVSLQVVLGIFTLLNATVTNNFILLGISHQFTAMLLVMCLVCLYYLVVKKLPQY